MASANETLTDPPLDEPAERLAQRALDGVSFGVAASSTSGVRGAYAVAATARTGG